MHAQYPLEAANPFADFLRSNFEVKLNLGVNRIPNPRFQFNLRSLTLTFNGVEDGMRQIKA